MEHTANLASYVPALVAHHLSTVPDHNAPLTAVWQGAVMFADISGFTALTEQLAQEGPGGAEKLTAILNDYFGRLVDTIHQHGGDVIKFAGDALFVVWGVQENATPDLTTAVLRTIQCAFAIQNRLHQYQTPDNFHLALRIAIGAGELTFFHLGGMYGRWEFLVAGEPLTQINEAEMQAAVHEVVISAAAWQIAQKWVTGEPLGAGALRATNFNWPELPQPLNISIPNTAVMHQALTSYVPGAINFRITAGQSSWLAEMRHLSILFINLPDLTHETPLAAAQQMILTLQNNLYRYEGSVNKISVDEKGATLVAAFGLPPMSHEDDAARSILAALSIVTALREQKVRVTIGVTRGRVFCGLVGTDQRREYTMIGDAVNLSARLMQLAGKMPNLTHPILCDAATYNASQSRLIYEVHPPARVKGKQALVSLYEPLRPLTAVFPFTHTQQAEAIGRLTEKRLLIEQILQIYHGRSCLTIVQGDAGIGKSHLLQFARAEAAKTGLTTFLATADAVERTTPYFAWRSVFNQLFDLSVFAQMENLPASQRHLLDLLAAEDDPTLLNFAPLLNPVLPFNLPENEYTHSLNEAARARHTEEMLLRLLQQSVALSPKLIIIEDAHWLDDTSWSFLSRVQQQVNPLMLLISMRPVIESPEQYERLLTLPELHKIKLEGLLPEEAEQLICYQLGVDSLPDQVSQLIWEKAEGHPFYTAELANNLRDAGYLVIKERTCHLATDIKLSQISLPDNLRAAIISRIDRLNAQQAMTLKVASVIGRSFTYQMLDHIYPISSDKVNLPQHLHYLGQLDLTLQEEAEPQLAYIFKHIITQEVAYELMSYNQRRQLHAMLAEWYESVFAADLSQVYALLGHHWQLGNEPERAMGYYAQAAAEAMKNYANREAIDFYTAALNMYRLLDTAVAASESWYTAYLGWQAELALAHYNIGQFAQTKKITNDVIRTLGHPLIEKQEASDEQVGQVQLRGPIARQLLRQLAHRVWPRLFFDRAANSTEKEQLIITVKVYSRLGSVYFFANQQQHFLYTILRALNAAERAGIHRELPISYAITTMVASAAGYPRLAGIYSRLAQEASEPLNDLSMQAFVLSRLSLAKINLGELAEVRKHALEAKKIYIHLGDERQQGVTLSLISSVDYYRGQFKNAVRLGQESAMVSRRIQNSPSTVAWLFDVAYAQIGLRDGAGAEATIQEMEKVLRQTSGYNKLGVKVLWMLWHAWQGQWAEVVPEMESTMLGYMNQTSTSDRFTHDAGRLCAVMLWWTEWTVAQTGEISGEQRRLLTQYLPRLEKVFQAFPIARGVLWWCQGWWAWLEGKHGRARRLWQKAQRIATKLEMWPLAIQINHTAGRLQTHNKQIRARHQATIEKLCPLTDLLAEHVLIPPDTAVEPYLIY